MNGFQILEFLKTKNWTKWLRMSMKHRLWFICGWLPVVWTRVPRPDDAIRPICSVYQFVKDVLIILFMLFVQFELLVNRDPRTARFASRCDRTNRFWCVDPCLWIWRWRCPMMNDFWYWNICKLIDWYFQNFRKIFCGMREILFVFIKMT